MHRATRLIALLLAAGGTQWAAAAAQSELTKGLRIYGSVEHSDNAQQVRGGDSATIKRVGLTADVAHDGTRVDYGLGGDASWADYSGALPGGVQGGISGYLDFGAREDILQWETRDSIRQSRLSALANATPDNTEFVNTFSTGPTLAFSIGDRDQLRFGSLYSRQTYQHSNFDSESLRASAALVRSLTGGARLGFNFAITGTSYTSHAIVAPGYDVREAYVNYTSAEGSRNALDLEAGITQSGSAGVRDTSPLLRLDLRRKVSDISSLYVKATRQYTSAAFVQPVVPAGPNYVAPISAPGAVRSTSLETGWSVSSQRNTLNLNTGWGKEDYHSAVQFDRKTSHVGGSFSHKLRPTLSAGLDAQYRIENLEGPAQPEAHFQELGFVMDKEFGRNFSGGLTVRHSRRNQAGISPYEFSEWRYGLDVAWQLTH